MNFLPPSLPPRPLPPPPLSSCTFFLQEDFLPPLFSPRPTYGRERRGERLVVAAGREGENSPHVSVTLQCLYARIAYLKSDFWTTKQNLGIRILRGEGLLPPPPSFFSPLPVLSFSPLFLLLWGRAKKERRRQRERPCLPPFLLSPSFLFSPSVPPPRSRGSNRGGGGGGRCLGGTGWDCVWYCRVGLGRREDGQDGNIPGESFGLMSLTNCSAKQDLILFLLLLLLLMREPPNFVSGGSGWRRMRWWKRRRKRRRRRRREKRGDETESRSLGQRKEEGGELVGRRRVYSAHLVPLLHATLAGGDGGGGGTLLFLSGVVDSDDDVVSSPFFFFYADPLRTPLATCACSRQLVATEE